MQVGDPEAGEFFGIALSLFPSSLQVTFEKAAPAVLRANVQVPRPVNCPGGLRGSLRDDIVDHLHAPGDRSNRWQLKTISKVSGFSR
ncbi:hypothetical protein N2604_34425 [Bradyrhizobium sp. CB1015]|nr:hypothetical protein [Bradyrhizobium sp. CB1015]UWU91478.1 hypothetical protein N2604_34425 [Bradyrhizobium sp. CB1015]